MTEEEIKQLEQQIYSELRNDPELEDAWMDGRSIAQEGIARAIRRTVAHFEAGLCECPNPMEWNADCKVHGWAKNLGVL